MERKLKILAAAFVFLGLLVWQIVEVERRRYDLRDLSARLEERRIENQKLTLEIKKKKSSEAMMKFAAGRQFRFPSTKDIIEAD